MGCAYFERELKEDHTVVSCHIVPVLRATVNPDVSGRIKYRPLDIPGNRDQLLNVIVVPIVQNLGIHRVGCHDS